MAVRGLEEATSRWDQFKKLSGFTLIAAVFAALVIGSLILIGVFDFIPMPEIQILGFTLPRAWVGFLGAFILTLVIVLGYVYYSRLVINTVRKIIAHWKDLSIRLQAVIIGLTSGIIAFLAFFVTDIYLHPFALSVVAGVGILVAIVVSVLTVRLVGDGWTLSEWGRTIYMSALISIVIAILTTFVFAGVIPGFVPPVLFLLVWLLCGYLLYRRRQTIEDSFVTEILTRTSYAQMRQVDPLTVPVGTGLVIAIIVSIIVGIFGTTPANTLQRVALSVVLVWPVVTFATSIGWPTVERTDLVITDIKVRESTNDRELTIRNLGDRVIELRNAKIADAYNTVYHLNVNTSVGAGGSVKLEIPEVFALASHDQYPVSSLPFGFVLTKYASEPRILTRDGKQFTLLWIDQLNENRRDEGSE